MSARDPRPLEIVMGPFQGMSATKNGAYAGPNEANVSNGIDYTDGTLRGLYKPGDSIATGVTAGTVSIHHRDGVGWLYQNDVNFVCFDGTAQSGSYSSTSPVGVSYYTKTSSGTSGYPQVSAGSNWTNQDLRVTTNAITSLTDGGGGGYRAYRITRVILLDDLNVTWESNPHPSVPLPTTNCNGAVIHFAAAGTNATGVTYKTRIYASEVGSYSEPLYLLDEIAGNLTSYTDSATAFPTVAGAKTPLDWSSGGKPSNTYYKYDHAAGPHLAVLANSLHGCSAQAAGVSSATYGSARAGILFGALGTTLYWSANGFPWYWPVLNAEDLDDTIEAIVTARSVTYVFTRSGVYAVTGSNDNALNISRTGAPYGCLPRAGLAVLQTPYGILYPCREGLALFDGTNARLVGADLLPAGSLTADGTHNLYAAYQDGLYTILTSSFDWGYVFDLRTWPNINLCKLTGPSQYVAFARVHPHATSLDANGLYVLNDSAAIKPWSPIQGGHNATRDNAWSHTTGYLTAGDLTRQKHAGRLWFSYKGTAPTITTKGYTWDGTQRGSTQTSTSAEWLGEQFTGIDYLTLTIAAGAADTQVFGLRVEMDLVA